MLMDHAVVISDIIVYLKSKLDVKLLILLSPSAFTIANTRLHAQTNMQS